MKRESWDLVAKEYDEAVNEEGNIYHEIYLNPLILKLLGDIKKKNILDLACGNGYFSRKLEREQAIVTGIDYSKELIRIAESKRKNNSKTEFIVGSSSNMKYQKNNSFDIIVSNVAFMDIKNIDDTIKECARVLKRGGKLIFSMTHPVFAIGQKKNDDGHYIKISKYMTPFAKEHKLSSVNYNFPSATIISSLRLS